jgi:hypothetical protein
MCLTWGTITSDIGKVLLTGTKDVYTEKDFVFVDDFNKPVAPLAGVVGSIAVDRRHGIVEVEVKLPDGKASPLNGRYRIKEPNKSSETNALPGL